MSKKPVVLVVEDNEIAQMKAVAVLSPYAEVLLAGAIRTAFRLLKDRDDISYVILDGYVPMFENDEVKVWKTIIVPNSPLSMHRHEHGRTIVVLKGGMITIQQDAGEKKTVEWTTGQAYWLDADSPGDKKHADVNETKEAIEVMVVEHKKDQ